MSIDVTINYRGIERAATGLASLEAKVGHLLTAEEKAALATDHFERAIRSHQRSTQRWRREMSDATRANEVFERSARGASLRVTEAKLPIEIYAKALGDVGRTVQGINPELDLFGQMLQSVSQGMSVAASMPGPWGVSLGALTGAMSAARAVMSHLKQESDDLARAQERAAASTRNLVDELRTARQVARLTSGTASISALSEVVDHADHVRGVIRQTLEDAREELRKAEQARYQTNDMSLRAQLKRDEAVRRHRAQVDSLVEALHNAEEGYDRAVAAQTRAVEREMEMLADLDRLQQEEDAQFRQTSRRGQGPRAAVREEEGDGVAGIVDDLLRDDFYDERIVAAELEVELQHEIARLREWQAEQDLAYANARKDAINDEWALINEINERNKRAQQAAAEERLAEARKITSVVGDSLQTIASTYNDLFGKVLEGQEDLEADWIDGTKNILKSIGDQMVAIGLKEALEGAANTVANPPVAATKIPMGLALIASGVALGAAGAAIPSQPSAPAERPRGDEGSGGGGDQMIVFNINQPLIGAGTYAQLGRQLNRQIEMGRGFGTRRAS